MSKYSSIDELYQAHTIEHEQRYESYMRNLRAACRRSGGYNRYKLDSRKYHQRHWRMWRKMTGKMLRHINNDLYFVGLIYTVVNGKVVRVRCNDPAQEFSDCIRLQNGTVLRFILTE